MEPATNLRFEWVTEPQRFLALRDEWNLLGSSAIKTVFLTHAWLATWLQELAPDAELHVLTAWDGDRLVAALPLFGTAEEGRGRRWAIMGTGTLTPNHLDIIAAPEVLERARDGIRRGCCSKSRRAGTCSSSTSCPRTPRPRRSSNRCSRRRASQPRARCRRSVRTATSRRRTTRTSRRARSTSARRSARPTAGLTRIPASARLALADTESAALEAQRVTAALPPGALAGEGLPGCLRRPPRRPIPRAHRPASFEAGDLRIYTLTDGDETVAVSYNFLIGHTMQGYLSSFDERWAASSPGVLLRTYVMEQSIAEGAARFDFLEGNEHYKAAWCTGERENLRLRVFNRTARRTPAAVQARHELGRCERGPKAGQSRAPREDGEDSRPQGRESPTAGRLGGVITDPPPGDSGLSSSRSVVGWVSFSSVIHVTDTSSNVGLA